MGGKGEGSGAEETALRGRACRGGSFSLNKAEGICSRVLIGQQNQAEETDSGLSIQKRGLKSPAELSSQVNLVSAQKAKGSGTTLCHGQVQEAMGTAASSLTTWCLLWTTPAQQMAHSTS